MLWATAPVASEDAASASRTDPIPGNLLQQETSPYLRQHAQNPVHWRPWGPEALAKARRLNRPILLSVGYAACHWCHVMAHESFEDPETAAVMNRLFVNIKVDREERPDIDHIYMSALQALGEQGGWPMTMFLTPDSEPIWGGTYFPKTARYGRPAFVDVLNSIATAFSDEPGRVDANRTALVAHLHAQPTLSEIDPDAKLLDHAAQSIIERLDSEHGGLRGSPKFPQPTLLEFLWRSADRTSDPIYRGHVLLTLRRMIQGGIYDHLGGGLSRYSVDDRWLVPHFEKMLYDNALLISRLTSAWRQQPEPLFRVRIEETIGWVFREMSVEAAFAASLDADSEGGEGSFYVWQPSEVAALLGETNSTAFCKTYDITEAGNFDGASIPNRLGAPNLPSDSDEEQLASQRAILLAARDNRPRPARDDKVLADWNGLAIAAIADAGVALQRPDWSERAAAAFRFITESMAESGRLHHSWRDGRLLSVGFASDHAAMLGAAIALHQATLDNNYLEAATRFADLLDEHYWDEGVKAYRMTANDAEGLIVRPLPIHDDSIPSTNALAATGLVRLGLLTGKQSHLDRVDQILRAHCSEPRAVLGMAGLFNALDQRLGAVEIVVIAPSGQDSEVMLRTIRDSWRETFVLMLVSATENLPENHPANGKTAIDGKPTAYVCRAQTCSAPLSDPKALAEILSLTPSSVAANNR